MKSVIHNAVERIRVSSVKAEDRAVSKPTAPKSTRPTHRAPAPTPKRGFHRPRNRG